MKRIASIWLTCLLAVFALLPVLTQTAHADSGDLDEIVNYDITVQPSADNGSLQITAALDWKVLDQGPVEWVKVGIPNGSVENITAFTESIDHLTNDSSYMYIYFDRGYDDGETIHFSYQWTQTYMYKLDGAQVTYDYTPGWFEEAVVDHMTLTWISPAGVTDGSFVTFCQGAADWDENTVEQSHTVTATNLSHGGKIQLTAVYASWPTTLQGDMSSENLPQDYENNGYGYQENDGGMAMIGIAVVAVIFFVIVVPLISAQRRDAWDGGFGVHYVFLNGLYYPAGPNGRPRPGSVGTPNKPAPPPRSGGFGGGRGGGFGGGGFGGGGGHCACASSCACACACACAGGGRAGCSAKNLYGAIHLPAKRSE